MNVLEWIAQKVVLTLGRLTFAALHLFEKLGADMASVDETLASWTAWSEDIKSQLEEAKTAVENLKANDAAEDAAQAEALLNEVEQKVQAAYETATSTPATTPPEETENPPVADQSLPGDQPQPDNTLPGAQ